jgi:PAS domain S-box-containing protein
MHPLADLLRENESWLMRRVRDYALERGYTRYTSTLEEAWRVSIAGLTDSITESLAILDEPWEFGPEDDFINDPVAAFGMLEARTHRSRGVTLGMFLGLMKYYRQGYLDLVRESFPPLQEDGRVGDGVRFSRFVERIFDRIEIAFCEEWIRGETVNTVIDELQAANREMTNEKNRFLTTFESLPTAVFVLEDKGLIILMNQSGARMINPSATSGGHYYSCPEERIPFPWLADELSRFRECGDENECESRIRLADGNERRVQARFRLMQDISFKFAGTVVILEDVTVLKRAEDELKLARDEAEAANAVLRRREEELRFTQYAIDSASDQAFWLTRDGCMFYVNDAACRTLGYTREELCTMSIPDIDTTHPPEVFADHWRDLQKTGSGTFESYHRSKDGRVYPVEIRANYVVFDGKEYNCAFVTDITERKVMETSLRKSEKKFRTLFEESKDTIFVLNTANRFIDINRAGVDLTGYTKAELLSLDPIKLYCDPQERKRLWQRVDSSGFVIDYEAEIRRKDGEKIIVHLSVSAIRDESGQISCYQGIVRDVTERKRLEQQLAQAQKMESIGVLAGGVAHDFNNLLTGISGFGEILKENIPADDELSHESIDQVLKAAGRASELTRNLLAFSRKQVIDPKPVHIDSLIGNTGKLIRRIIGEDIEFSTSFSGKKLIVMADPGQMEQVLMNLASNSRDAMPHGGSLKISVQRTDIMEGSEELCDLSAPGKYALITVEDTGMGIDRKSIERLFEPFYTTKEIGKGTGLGLSIVYGIIKQHNGAVTVSSEPGKGTTFRIYLPLIDDCEVTEQSKMCRSFAGGTETLLTIDDEEIVNLMLKRTLEREGYKVITAGDGEDAISKFREYRDDISLVISDVVMPKKNGKELLEEIRNIKQEMKFIFISGYATDVLHGKGIDGDDVDILTKPFSKYELLRKVRAVLDRGEGCCRDSTPVMHD